MSPAGVRVVVCQVQGTGLQVNEANKWEWCLSLFPAGASNQLRCTLGPDCSPKLLAGAGDARSQTSEQTTSFPYQSKTWIWAHRIHPHPPHTWNQRRCGAWSGPAVPQAPPTACHQVFPLRTLLGLSLGALLCGKLWSPRNADLALSGFSRKECCRSYRALFKWARPYSSGKLYRHTCTPRCMQDV